VTDLYQALLDDLAAEHAELDAIVASLPAADWSRPTPAEGWTIGDTILHLALTDEAAALAAADPSAFEAYRQQRRARGVDPFQLQRATPPADLLAMWRKNCQRLEKTLASIDDKRRIEWFGPPMSATSHVTARLMETWAHGQDIVDALGLQRAATPRLKHIAHLGVRTRAYSYTQHGMTPPTNDVRVELDAPGGDGQWSWGASDAEDRVSGPALDFCLVVVQRRHLDDTDLSYAGPHAREWLLVAQAFAGVAGGGRQPMGGTPGHASRA
jgi:uncharacterized protein (TIGR03084 family)